MKKGVVKILVPVFLLVCQGGLTAGSVKSFSAVAFQGLKHLSKYEIIEGVPVQQKKGTIFIDMAVLKKRLAAMPLVKEFSFSAKGKKLVIRISERKSAFTLGVKNRRELIFLEISSSEKIISRGRILGGERPVIFCERKDLAEGRFSLRVRGAMKLLAYLQAERKRLYRELQSLSFVGGGKYSLTLKGRTTRFVIEASKKGFKGLEVVAGYCDRVEKYPETVVIEGSRIVVR